VGHPSITLESWKDGPYLEFIRKSTHGEFRVADKSGHWIQRDQPELVLQAIEDVSGEAKTR
jgi:pimeloyl-ACP methyl ester carboxylesterase